MTIMDRAADCLSRQSDARLWRLDFAGSALLVARWKWAKWERLAALMKNLPGIICRRRRAVCRES
jgi:hypothetical protein